jgi:NO-binding membrane sensor protein with MHYT domain
MSLPAIVCIAAGSLIIWGAVSSAVAVVIGLCAASVALWLDESIRRAFRGLRVTS